MPAAPVGVTFLMAAQLGDRSAYGAVHIDTFTPDPLPMPVAGPEVGEALVAMLKDRGIGFQPERPSRSSIPHPRTLHFDDGTSTP
ncbi:dehydrogenase/reductase domain protein [Mycobacterium kansasii 732]|nr:hypothetical protein [Mycobacterium pseudokansasii]EUA15081.1 dehydrogenase/reductase domain protein [Mycobacterium kansasii 732]KZS61172.1 hypothetical protein A4G27_16075 [Mycobacterium kansasii]VAZ88613.1 hypothetical protein LAUMK35_00607 [Mycobacterium pseudokansasii]VAZ89091.1 hypothetical protein LAUMK21_00608 [Mycobacterium pseudokansasii]